MSNDKQAAKTISREEAEKLPVLMEQDGIVVVNKARIDLEYSAHKTDIERAVEEMQDFFDKKPDLTSGQEYDKLKSLLGNKKTAHLAKAIADLTDKKDGMKAIFLAGGNYVQEKYNELYKPAIAVKKEAMELRNAHEAEVERIAMEEARKEEERINRIESRIEFIRDLPSECIGKDSVTIKNYIFDLVETEEDFQELEEVGSAALKRSLEQLKKLLESVLAEEELEKKQRIAEEERKQREAEERAEFKRQQEELAIHQEAAEIAASVAGFVSASPEELQGEVLRLSNKYGYSNDQVIKEAVKNVTGILSSMIPAAEQRESVARQAVEQEAERQRLEAEKQEETRRKAEKEERRKAEQERAKIEAAEAAERKRLIEEAECRKAEDFGRTVAALSDLLGKLLGGDCVDCAETVAEAIVDGEIPFVTWKNER